LVARGEAADGWQVGVIDAFERIVDTGQRRWLAWSTESQSKRYYPDHDCYRDEDGE